MEYEFDGHTYKLTKLGLGDAKEVLLRLMKLGIFTGDEVNVKDAVANLSVKDLRFFEEKLFGTHLHFQNDSGNWVPLGGVLVDKHFDGRLGSYFHMLIKCIMFNYADFLAGLHIEELAGGEQQTE